MPKTTLNKETLRRAHLYFSDNSTAESFLELSRWPDGVSCPDCRKTSIQRRLPGAGSYKCKACGRSWTVRQGTCMDRSKVALGVWAAAVVLHSECEPGAAFVDLLLQVTAISGKTAESISRKLDEMGPPRVANPLPGRGEVPVPVAPAVAPSAPEKETSPNLPTAAKGLRPAPMLAAAVGGAAIALIFVFALGPRSEVAATQPQPQAYGRYVGELPTQSGGKAHVSYVMGTRVETPISAEDSAESSLDRHLRNVERIRIVPTN